MYVLVHLRRVVVEEKEERLRKKTKTKNAAGRVDEKGRCTRLMGIYTDVKHPGTETDVESKKTPQKKKRKLDDRIGSVFFA